MVFGRITEAVSDLKETLRRVFRDPPSHSLDTGSMHVRPHRIPSLATELRDLAYQLDARSVMVPFEIQATLTNASVQFQGRLQVEDGWATWASGARVLEMPVFGAGEQLRMAVPPLPCHPPCHRLETEPFRAFNRGFRENFVRPPVRRGSPEIAFPAVRGGLDLALSLPIAIQGQDVQTLPRVQWMRYSLQLVKSTGENIRNLEVLGLYQIPSRGVAGMRHDAKSGRLLLELSRDASGASRLPFLLARRRDDRTLVSCFLEEG